MKSFSEQTIQAALSRYQPEIRLAPDGFKQASVLIPFYPDPDGLSLVFMKRPDGPGPHDGQISFPGGARDLADEDARQTALRETEEEIGIAREAITLWGRLSDSCTLASRYWITPFVGKILYPSTFHPNRQEVERLLIIPFTHLLDQTHFSVERYSWKGGEYTTLIFRYRQDVIWGLTARLLHNLISLLQNGSEFIGALTDQ